MEKPRYPPPSIPIFCVGAAPLVVSGFFYLHTKSITNAISVGAAGIVTGILHWAGMRIGYDDYLYQDMQYSSIALTSLYCSTVVAMSSLFSSYILSEKNTLYKDTIGDCYDYLHHQLGSLESMLKQDLKYKVQIIEARKYGDKGISIYVKLRLDGLKSNNLKLLELACMAIDLPPIIVTKNSPPEAQGWVFVSQRVIKFIVDVLRELSFQQGKKTIQSPEKLKRQREYEQKEFERDMKAKQERLEKNRQLINQEAQRRAEERRQAEKDQIAQAEDAIFWSMFGKVSVSTGLIGVSQWKSKLRIRGIKVGGLVTSGTGILAVCIGMKYNENLDTYYQIPRAHHDHMMSYFTVGAAFGTAGLLIHDKYTQS